MQLQLRIDDGNFLDVTYTLQASSDGQPHSGPEVTQAAITNSKLSNLTADQILDITAQVIDFFAAETSPGAKAPEGDWFANEWLPNCR